MVRYHHDVNTHHQKRFKKRSRLLIISLIAVVLAGAGVVLADIWQQSRQEADPDTPRTSSTYQPQTQTFETDFFSFTADIKWIYVEDESATQRFVYRSLRETLIEQELVIYVDGEAPHDTQITRVLPVIASGATIHPEIISDRCETSLPPGSPRRLVETTMERVRFQCQADGTNYIVVVGDKNSGTDFVNLNRADGTTAAYRFIYTNSTSSPDPTILPAIISTFEAR